MEVELTQIRIAELQDAAGISSLLRAAFAEFEPLYTPAAFASTTPVAEEIASRIETSHVWVATRGSDLVGTCSIVEKPEGVYIRSMAVLPSARGLGIGRKLLDKVEDFARTRRAHRLFLCTTPFLHAAIQLYGSLGFQRYGEPHELFGTPLFDMQKFLR